MAIPRELGDRRGMATRWTIWGLWPRQGDFASARALYEESLAIRRELGDRRGIASSLNNLGNVALEQGDYRPPGRCTRRAWLSRGNWGTGGHRQLAEQPGDVAYEQGDYPAAQALYQESLAIGGNWETGGIASR